MKISFIGFGNMAKAIAKPLKGNPNFLLTAASPSLVPDRVESISTYPDNVTAVAGAEVVILAVKPKVMASVLREIVPYLPSSCLLISIAAGLNLSWLSQRCKPGQALIRAMPNTPVAVQLGYTPLIASQTTTLAQREMAESIFSILGLTLWLKNDEEMDSFTALSGSGPAYIYSFIEAMTQAGVTLGLDAAVAKSCCLQTMKGALELVQQSNLSVSQLKTEVTSPGGTTEAALQILDKPLAALMISALKAAKLRAQSLG